MRVVTLALLLSLAVGCGNPLVGKWASTTYPGGPMPSDVASYEQDLTFGSDMTLAVRIAVGVPASASVYPGCQQTCDLSGLTWTSMSANDTMTITVSGSATKTASRSGCASAADNMPPTPATSTDCTAGMPSGAYAYTLANGTLTTTGAGGTAVSYTRQAN